MNPKGKPKTRDLGSDHATLYKFGTQSLSSKFWGWINLKTSGRNARYIPGHAYEKYKEQSVLYTKALSLCQIRMHGNLKKKFISEFIRFLVCRTGVVLFSSFLWRAKASAPRASGGGIGMRVGGIFLSIQPRACLALSARLALSSAQQKKKGIEF